MSQAEALLLPAPRSKYGSAGEPTPQSNTEKPVLAAGRSPLNRSSTILRSTTPDTSQRPNVRRLAELAAALTLRDVAILSALDQYRYLDAAQIEALYYTGQRRCELRLSQLRQRGLLARWIALKPPDGPRCPVCTRCPHSEPEASPHGAAKTPDRYWRAASTPGRIALT